MLTAYDYTTAAILDQSGIEGILVGDTMAMVVQGHDLSLIHISEPTRPY